MSWYLLKVKKRNVFTLFVLAVILVYTCNGKRLSTYAGPWRAIIGNVNNVTEEYPHSTGKVWARLYASHPKPKEHQYAWGKVYVGMPVGDDVKIEVKMSKRSNNQWKRNAFVMKFERACSDILFHAKFIPEFVYGRTDLKCPFPQMGLQDAPNRTFDIKFPQFPVFPYDQWLFTVAFLKGAENIGVVVATAVTEPIL